MGHELGYSLSHFFAQLSINPRQNRHRDNKEERGLKNKMGIKTVLY